MHKNLSIKLSIISIMIAMVIGLFSTTIYAAEITPDPDSYSYGSTSEISPFETVETSDDVLADTGESTQIIIVASIAMCAVGAVFLLSQLRKKSPVKLQRILAPKVFG